MSTVARLGRLRLARGRLNVFSPIYVKVTVHTTAREAYVDPSSIEIEDNLRESYNYARFRCQGFTPTVGQEVYIGLGEVTFNRLFAGRILSIRQEAPARLVAGGRTWYHVTAVDWTWDLDDRMVLERYTSTSATNIALDLLATYTTGFTTKHVQTSLATVDEVSFTNETVSGALTRLANLIGGFWYVDEQKDVHFFTSEALGYTPETLSGSSVFSYRTVSFETDLSQIRTRVFVEGLGGTLNDANPGGLNDPTDDIYIDNADEIFGDPSALGVSTYVRYKDGVFEYDLVSGGTGLGGGLNLTAASGLDRVALGLRLLAGNEANQWVTRNDTAAQTALAALTGRDGIREHYIQDRRLSYTGSVDRGDADLALYADPIKTLRYTTRDPNVRSGLTVTVNYGSAPHSAMNGTYRIRRVVTRMVEESQALHPEREVEAVSALAEDFYGVLRRLERRTGARAET